MCWMPKEIGFAFLCSCSFSFRETNLVWEALVLRRNLRTLNSLKWWRKKFAKKIERVVVSLCKKQKTLKLFYWFTEKCQDSSRKDRASSHLAILAKNDSRTSATISSHFFVVAFKWNIFLLLSSAFVVFSRLHATFAQNSFHVSTLLAFAAKQKRNTN